MFEKKRTSIFTLNFTFQFKLIYIFIKVADGIALLISHPAKFLECSNFLRLNRTLVRSANLEKTISISFPRCQR